MCWGPPGFGEGKGWDRNQTPDVTIPSCCGRPPQLLNVLVGWYLSELQKLLSPYPRCSSLYRGSQYLISPIWKKIGPVSWRSGRTPENPESHGLGEPAVKGQGRKIRSPWRAVGLVSTAHVRPSRGSQLAWP